MENSRELIDLINLEKIEENIFRGQNYMAPWKRVFGGQVIGQALVAASRTVPEERFVHSLHGYFMRPGDPTVPIIYDVDRIREGKSFLTRRVVAIQHGHAIFSMSASFQRAEEGLDHQATMPHVPVPLRGKNSEAARISSAFRYRCVNSLRMRLALTGMGT